MRYYLVILVLAAGNAWALFDSYTIKLDRPYTVGMVTRETISIENEVRIKQREGVQPQIVKESAELEMMVTVLKMGRKNRYWKEIEIVPLSFDYQKKSPEDHFSAIRKRILVTRGFEEISFKRRDSKELRKAEIALLKPFFSMPAKHELQEAFGTDEQVKKGDSWEFDRVILCDMLRSSSNRILSCRPAKTSGNMTLSRVWTFKGKKILTVGGTATFNELKVNSPKFNGLQDVKAEAKLGVNFSLPLDLDQPVSRVQQTFSWQIEGTRPGEKPQPFLFANTTTLDRTIEVLKSPNEKDDQ